VRKIYFILFLLIFITPLTAKAEFFHIEHYNVDVLLNNDSSAYFEETILVNFHSPRHGIYRFIPYKYKNKKLRIKILSVKTSYNGEFFNNEKYKRYSKNGNIVLRIGSKNRVYKGLKYYKIVYKVLNAVNNNEFYWNIIGTQWPVIIKKAEFSITFPQVRDLAQLKRKVFYGRFKSRKTLNFHIDSTSMTTLNPVFLKPYNGLTVDLLFPLGIISEPPLPLRIFWFITDNIGYIFTVIIFFILLGIWNKWGKDEKKDVLIVRYEPPKGFTPAEVGTLIDDKVDLKDIVATILDLAERGYIKIIKDVEKKFFISKTKICFERLKDSDRELKPHELTVLNGLFQAGSKKVCLEDLKNRFYIYVDSFKEYMYRNLSDKNHLYTVNPETIRKGFRYTAYMFVIFGIFWLIINNFNVMTSIGAGSIISGLLILLFANIMPQKTHEGSKIYRQILGFKEFIEKVETDRLKRFAEKDPQIFGKILPYAVALGIEDKWAQKFQGIDLEPPHWYHSSYGSRFSTVYFISMLNRDFSQMNDIFISQPHSSSGSGFSSGGGFSGGGIGGGGGGSW